jgi:hypothetical protein
LLPERSCAPRSRRLRLAPLLLQPLLLLLVHSNENAAPQSSGERNLQHKGEKKASNKTLKSRAQNFQESQHALQPAARQQPTLTASYVTIWKAAAGA